MIAAPPLNPNALYRDPDLGDILLPRPFYRSLSLPGQPIRRPSLKEIGVFVAKQFRPIFDDDGRLLRMEMIWHSITHNERVDAGAAIQANRVFGTSGTTANGVFTALALAKTTFTTKTKTDKSIGSSSQADTTNEWTTNGLARMVGTVSTYTGPSSLGGQFTQLITGLWTATSTGGTAHGSAVFDSVTPAGSNMYVEDIFSTDAPTSAAGDTVAVSASILN